MTPMAARACRPFSPTPQEELTIRICSPNWTYWPSGAGANCAYGSDQTAKNEAWPSGGALCQGRGRPRRTGRSAMSVIRS